LGVIELEFGLQRSSFRDGSDLFWTPALLKLGLLRRVELRIGDNGLLRQTAPGAMAEDGVGDLVLGGQWCVVRNGGLGLDSAVQYSVKLPTANPDKGLGSGHVDQTLMLLLSRDFGPFHADFNLLETWLGRPVGTERQPAGTLSVSRTLSDRFS